MTARTGLSAGLLALGLLYSNGASADPLLRPLSAVTPGAVLAGCTLQDLRTPGYAHQARPPASFTNAIKRRQLRSDYAAQGSSQCVEEDHLVPIGWCGDPQSGANLWPQLRERCGAPPEASAERKDDCEWKGQQLLKRGKLQLSDAQHGVAQDWVAYCNDTVLPLARASGIRSFR